MTEHLSTEIVERFHRQALAAAERIAFRHHLLKCDSCRQQILNTQTESVALTALSNHLLVETDEEPYHLEYEAIQGYVEGTLDRVDRATADMHLEMCSECSHEVEDLRESIVTMSVASVPQVEKRESQRDTFWPQLRFSALPRPLRISALVTLAVVAVVAAIAIWRLNSKRANQEQNPPQFSAGALPSPIESPKNAQAVSSPQPTPAGSPGRPLEVKPSDQSPRQGVIALADGPHRIVLDNSGNLRGLELMPGETQQAVRETLIAQTIRRPDVLDQLNSAQVSLRAPSGNEDTATIVYPAKTVITEDQPVFTWVPSKTASGYRVEIGDSQFRSVAKSDVLPSNSRSWRPPTPLKRGGIYTFALRVFKEGDESGSIAPPKSFKVLEDQKIKELTLLKETSESHLALGVFYAREGLLAEAAREFEILTKENPHSSVVKRLARQVHSWQR